MAHGVSQHSGMNKVQRTGRAPWSVSTGKWSQCFPNEQRLGRLTKLERLTEFIALHIVNAAAAAAAAKSLQSCTTLCDPIDGSPPGVCSLFEGLLAVPGCILFVTAVGRRGCVCCWCGEGRGQICCWPSCSSQTAHSRGVSGPRPRSPDHRIKAQRAKGPEIRERRDFGVREITLHWFWVS